jgi:hypothetical protein
MIKSSCCVSADAKSGLFDGVIVGCHPEHHDTAVAMFAE